MSLPPSTLKVRAPAGTVNGSAIVVTVEPRATVVSTGMRRARGPWTKKLMAEKAPSRDGQGSPAQPWAEAATLKQLGLVQSLGLAGQTSPVSPLASAKSNRTIGPGSPLAKKPEAGVFVTDSVTFSSCR